MIGCLILAERRLFLAILSLWAKSYFVLRDDGLTVEECFLKGVMTESGSLAVMDGRKLRRWN